MLVECNRLASDPDGEALCRAIESTLLDVRSAVQDWRGMLSRLQLLSASFTALDSAEAAETKAFLSWLEQGHFTFLGAQDFVAEGRPAVSRCRHGVGYLEEPGFPGPARAEGGALHERPSLVALCQSHPALQRSPPDLAGHHQRQAAGRERQRGG